MALATALTPFSKLAQMGPMMPQGSDLDKVVSAINSMQAQTGTTAYNGKFADLTVTGTLTAATLSSTGNVSITGTLAVTGASTFTGAMSLVGALNVGSTLTVTGATNAAGLVTATLGVADGAVQAVTTSTTGTAVHSYGIITLATTTAGQTFNLADPVAGRRVAFFCTVATSQLLTPSSTAVTIQSTTGLTQKNAAFTLSGQCLVLQGISTTAFAVVGNTGGVTFT